MITIRFSEILSFLKCRKKHQLEFIQELEPSTLNDRMLVGTWGHLALKMLLKGQDEDSARSAISDDIVKYLGRRRLTTDQADMAELALKCAAIGAKRFLARFEPVEVEEHVLYQYKAMAGTVDVQLAGTPDVIAKEHASGNIWLFDHKFRNMFRQPKAELLNLQMSMYTGLIHRARDFRVVGSRQFQIKPIEPREPKLTAKNTVSKQNITTDWQTYERTVKAYGLDIRDYLDMKEKLDDKVFFDLDSSACIRSQAELDFTWNSEILPVVDDIVTARMDGGAKAYRCYDFGSCNFCKMEDYCVAELKGDDLEYLRKTKFHKKGDKSRLLEIVDDEDEETVQD